MSNHRIIVAGLVVGAACAGVSAQSDSGGTTTPQTGVTATAQPAGDAKPAEATAGDEADKRTKLDDWHGSAALNLWAPSMSGNLSARSQSIHISESFLEVVKQADSLFGLNGRFELGKGIFTGYVDGTYLRVGFEDQLTSVGPGVDVTTEMTFLEFGLEVQLGHWLRDEPGSRPAGAPERYIDLSVYLGGRYTDVGLELQTNGAAVSNTQNRSWIDPLVGVRLGIDLCPNWKVVINGDVGGFGVGSQFSWAAQVLFDYRFDMWGADASFTFGYRALDENYSKQRDVGEFKFDMTLYGPIFGLTVRF